MNIDLKQEQGLTTAVLGEKRLDAAVAKDFRASMEQIISDGNHQLILDISSVKFMDSSSLGAMVAVLKLISSTGKLVVLGASGAVLELFKLTRMDRIFTLADSPAAARQYF